jgi:site-specific DNA-cytosine methylase
MRTQAATEISESRAGYATKELPPSSPPPARTYRGGPPCQKHSQASEIVGTHAEDYIPEFVRLAYYGRFKWIVMENVLGAIGNPEIPKQWNRCVLRDWDCGGQTSRERVFWTWPMQGPYLLRADGKPAKSVMATTWKRGKSTSQYIADKGFLPGDLPIEEYGRLQGCEELAASMKAHPSKMSRSFIVHCLGNGVPLPMGRAIAKAVKAALQRSECNCGFRYPEYAAPEQHHFSCPYGSPPIT